MQFLPRMLDAANRFEARPPGAEMTAEAAEFGAQPVIA
jgi:hypothetical protein